MASLKTKFSARPRLVGAVAAVALLSLAVVFAFEEIYLLPTIAAERERRVEVFPALLAVSNQTAIITNDLANLRASLEKTIASLEGSGIRYIIVQDADGKLMGEAWDRDVAPEARAAMVQAIRARATIITRRSGEAASAVDQSKLTADERAALTGSAETTVATVELPEGILPKVEKAGSWRLPNIEPAVVDHSVPISTGSIPFGAVRVGVVDEIAEGINHMRLISYTAFIMILVGGGLVALYLANTVDSNFAVEMSDRMDDVRKEMEGRIRQLESEQQRKEEENPITPSEFLALLDFARKVSGSLDYNEVLQVAIHTCLQVMNVRDCSIFVQDVSTNELVGRVGHDENGMMSDEEMARIRVPVGKGDIGAAAEFGTTTTIDSPRPGSGVVSALVSRGRTIGVILVRNKLNGRPFIKKDQTVIRIFSGLLANAMENAAIFHHLSRAAEGSS